MIVIQWYQILMCIYRLLGEFAYLLRMFSDKFKRLYLKNIMAGFSYNFLMLQEGGTPSGPSGLLSNTQKWTDRRPICWQSKRLYGKGHPGGEQQVGDPGGLLCQVTHSLRFYGGGLVSRLSLDSHSDSGSVMVAHVAQPTGIPANRILGGW